MGSVTPESPLERRVLSVLKQAGLPAPESQYTVKDGADFVARVDFAYPAHRVAIEAEGYAFHSGRIVWEKDLERRNALQRLGWRVIQVTWRQLDEQPGVFIAHVAALLGLQRLFGP